jgi:hypothetical protein
MQQVGQINKCMEYMYGVQISVTSFVRLVSRVFGEVRRLGLAPLFLDQRIDIPTRLANLRLALSVPLVLC